MAAGLFDEAVDLAQPKPGALADGLGREEGFERLRDGIGVHADSRIGYR